MHTHKITESGNWSGETKKKKKKKKIRNRRKCTFYSNKFDRRANDAVMETKTLSAIFTNFSHFHFQFVFRINCVSNAHAEQISSLWIAVVFLVPFGIANGLEPLVLCHWSIIIIISSTSSTTECLEQSATPLQRAKGECALSTGEKYKINFASTQMLAVHIYEFI